MRAAELREEIDAGFFHQAAEPFRQLAERDDIVPFVPERWRRDRHAQRGILREEERGIVRDGRIERRALLIIRHELSQRLWIHDGAGKLVRADLTAFLEDVDALRRKLRAAGRLRSGLVVFLDEIRQVQRASQPRRPRADDQYVRLELFALRGHGLF